MPVEKLEELATINAASVRSGWSRYQIEHAILRGELRAVQSGNRLLVPVDALNEFVATHGDSPRRSA